jgi:hypothetical protein
MNVLQSVSAPRDVADNAVRQLDSASSLFAVFPECGLTVRCATIH